MSHRPSTNPVVDIAVGGRFHAFDLARNLARHGALGTLYTGYPAFAGPAFGVPWRRISSVWTQEPLNRLAARLHRRGLLAERADAKLSARFDRVVAQRLRRGAHIFVGWSSQCLQTLRVAKTYGMITFVERGSCHILWQKAIMEEEADRTGIATEIPLAEIVARELAEYDTADYIAVPSRFAAETFMDQGIAKQKLIINPYGVDVQVFQPASAAARHTAAGLRVLHVGRVSLQKGVQYLVPAVGALKGASLCLVGGIDPGMAALLNAPFVTAHGAVSRHALPAFYRQADVFCLLSLQEGLALVLAQAMAMGLPVVATANTGAAELITDGVEGYIVAPRDPAAVSEKLAYLAAHPAERMAMGARARARVLQNLSWAAYGERASRIYRDRFYQAQRTGEAL